MHLTPLMQRYVLHWGEMAGRWGISRSVAQMHALLYLSPTPLSADEIAETLGIARSNVSMGIRELQGWDLVSVAHVMGDRRDYFQAQQDIWEVIRAIIDGRKKREIDPTVAALRECAAEFAKDHETPKAIKERINNQLEFLETMSTWYLQIKRLPRKTLLKMMKMGERIARVIGD